MAGPLRRRLRKHHPPPSTLILVNSRRGLAAISPNGLIGDRVIQDTHHTTLLGYVALAGAVLRGLQARNVFPNAKAIAVPLDPTACARHFDMDAAEWATLCDGRASTIGGWRIIAIILGAAGGIRQYAEAVSRTRSGIDASSALEDVVRGDGS